MATLRYPLKTLFESMPVIAMTSDLQLHAFMLKDAGRL